MARVSVRNINEHNQKLIEAAADSIQWRIRAVLEKQTADLETRLIETIAAWTDSYADIIGTHAEAINKELGCAWTNGPMGEMVMKRATPAKAAE